MLDLVPARDVGRGRDRARSGGCEPRDGLVERLVVMNAVPFLPGYRWHPMARIWRAPLLGELFMGSITRRN